MTASGHDVDDILFNVFPNLINDALANHPKSMHVAMHLCRGNNQSGWLTEGGYDPVAEMLFNKINVDSYMLEYDTARAGGFAPLRFVPKHKSVVLGIVSSKVPQLESKDDLKRRIDEAAKHIDLDQLGISPQCGFASTAPGNKLTPDRAMGEVAPRGRSRARGLGLMSGLGAKHWRASSIARRASWMRMPTTNGSRCGMRTRLTGFPATPMTSTPTQNVSVIYDRRGQLRARIQRLKETSWLREQAPRLKRLVSNIEVESATDSEVVVSSAFILAELHHHKQYLWAGSTTHKLIPNGHGFKIKSKKVLLLNNNEPLPNLLFLI